MFGLNNWSQEAYDYLYGTGRVNARYAQTVVSANVQGDCSILGGHCAACRRHRISREHIDLDSRSDFGVRGFYVSNSAAIAGSVDVKEAYLETSVPLAKDLPFANSLELNGAVRTTDYNTSGNVTAWKYGVVYEPLDWLRFRSTRSRDIRAPNVNELYAPQSTGFATVDNQLVQQTTGGNPTLIPESADTFTVGMTVRGEGWLEGLRASVDYYDIDIANAISASSGQLLANRCRQFGVLCSAVDFNAAGAVVAVRATQQNLLRLQASGIDYEVNYRMPLSRVFDSAAGSLDFGILASRSIHLRTTDLAGIIERAGQTGGNVSGGLPGLPNWTLNGTITTPPGPCPRRWRRVTSSPASMTPRSSGRTGGLQRLASNSINTNRVNGATYVNLGTTYKLTTPRQ